MSIEAMKLALELLAVATFHSPELQAKRTEVIERGLQAIAEADKQEPVAWELGAEVYWNDSPALSDYIRKEGTPLYTHPQPAQPKREPLTDELLSALDRIVKTVPAQDGNGGFIVDHHDMDGEYLGTQQIDPMWVVQEMAAIAHNALEAHGIKENT